MQLIIAGLKTSLHLTPFCLLDLILAIIKRKILCIRYWVCQIVNQNFPIIWLAVWFAPILNILSFFLKFRVKNHLYNYRTQINYKYNKIKIKNRSLYVDIYF